MRRFRFGLDAWLEPSEFHALEEDLNKDVIAKTLPFMVKLKGFDASGKLVQEASGFLYTPDRNVIITCNHIRYIPQPPEQQQQPPEQQQPVARFTALYASDGMEEEVHVVTPSYPHYDLMLLRGTRGAPNNFRADHSTAGDKVYVAGFPPGSDKACYSKRMVMSSLFNSVMVDAHADNGWSGGPIVNRHGRLLGVVQQGQGFTIKHPEAISAVLLQVFLGIVDYLGLRD
eukprot:gene17357-23661_t